MSVTRVGTASGLDQTGRLQTVSVYRDGGGYKLSGRGGSHIVPQPAIDAAIAAIVERYRLSDVEFVRSTRAA